MSLVERIRTVWERFEPNQFRSRGLSDNIWDYGEEAISRILEGNSLVPTSLRHSQKVVKNQIRKYLNRQGEENPQRYRNACCFGECLELVARYGDDELIEYASEVLSNYEGRSLEANRDFLINTVSNWKYMPIGGPEIPSPSDQESINNSVENVLDFMDNEYLQWLAKSRPNTYRFFMTTNDTPFGFKVRNNSEELLNKVTELRQDQVNWLEKYNEESVEVLMRYLRNYGHVANIGDNVVSVLEKLGTDRAYWSLYSQESRDGLALHCVLSD